MSSPQTLPAVAACALPRSSELLERNPPHAAHGHGRCRLCYQQLSIRGCKENVTNDGQTTHGNNFNASHSWPQARSCYAGGSGSRVCIENIRMLERLARIKGNWKRQDFPGSCEGEPSRQSSAIGGGKGTSTGCLRHHSSYADQNAVLAWSLKITIGERVLPMAHRARWGHNLTELPRRQKHIIVEGAR